MTSRPWPAARRGRIFQEWMTALDVSKNTKLETLRCEGNRLTFLDLQGLDGLVNPASVDVGGQTRDGLTVQQSGSEYVVNLGAFLSADRFVKVKDLAGHTSGNTRFSPQSFSNGKATFDTKPEKVTYQYDTGKTAHPMEVSLVEAIKPPVSPDVPPGTPEPDSGGGCDAGVSGLMLALVGAFLLRRKV